MLNGQAIPADAPRIESYDLADGLEVFICPFFGVGQMTSLDANVLVEKGKDQDIRF